MHPDTHPSLLVRIRDARNREAWYEFAKIYRPVIVRVARAKGMQDADADDLAQRVLVSVAGAIERFDPAGDAKAMKQQELQTIDAKIDALRKLFAESRRAEIETDLERTIETAKRDLARSQNELEEIEAAIQQANPE